MNADLQIGKVAHIFHKSTQTIRNWVDRPELAEFFSVTAKGKPGKPSIFDENDFAVLASINSLLSDGEDWLSIANRLRMGWRETKLPENAAAIAATSHSSIQLAGRALSAEDRLKMALERLSVVQDELFQRERDHSAKVEDLMREIADLKEIVGASKREIALYESGRLRPPASEG